MATEQEENPLKTTDKLKSKISTKKAAMKILTGNFLVTKESPRKTLTFLLFMLFLAIIYIANTHYAEKIIKETQNSNTVLKDVRPEYIAIKSRLMYKSKQSEVAKSIEHLGIKESTDQPIKIIE